MHSTNRNIIHKNININESICGILSLPSQQGIFPAILFLHGFATDKNEVNSIYKYMANSLNTMNVATLRIDFRCWGDSIGKTEQSTIDKMVDDALESIKYLREQNIILSQNIGIIGFSLGAAIAMLSCKYGNCKSLALISPALDLEQDFVAFLGKDIMEKLHGSTSPIDICLPWRTVKLSKDFHTSLIKNIPRLAIQHYLGDLYCVAGKRDFTCKNAIQIINESASPKNKLTIIDNADHIFSLTNGTSELFNVADSVTSWMSIAINS